jgi:hypothetical protein
MSILPTFDANKFRIIPLPILEPTVSTVLDPPPIEITAARIDAALHPLIAADSAPSNVPLIPPLIENHETLSKLQECYPIGTPGVTTNPRDRLQECRQPPFNIMKAQEWLQIPNDERPPPEPPPKINNLQITGVATPQTTISFFSYLFSI